MNYTFTDFNCCLFNRTLLIFLASRLFLCFYFVYTGPILKAADLSAEIS